MNWIDIAKTTFEVTKEQQKSVFKWLMVTFFGKHYLKFLTDSLVIEWVAKIKAERQIAHFVENPDRVIDFLQAEAEIEYSNMFGVIQKILPKINTWTPNEQLVDNDKIKRLKDLSKEFSSEDMQEVIASILAWEYNQPWSFSLATMDRVRSLSKDDIRLFRNFWAIVFDGNDFFLSHYDISNSWLKIMMQEWIWYDKFLYLQEIWLVGGNRMSRKMWVLEDIMTDFIYSFKVQDKMLNFHKKGSFVLEWLWSLTRAGKELLPIVWVSRNDILLETVESEFIRQFS